MITDEQHDQLGAAIALAAQVSVEGSPVVVQVSTMVGYLIGAGYSEDDALSFVISKLRDFVGEAK